MLELMADGEPLPGLIAGLRAGFKAGMDAFFDAETGAVCEPGRRDTPSPFLFTEVTGYALIELVEQWEASGDAAFLQQALKAAGWLCRNRTEGGARDPETGFVLTRKYEWEDGGGEPSGDKERLYAFRSGNVFAFDNAIVLLGLVRLAGALVGRRAWEDDLNDIMAAARSLGGALTDRADANGIEPVWCVGTDDQVEGLRDLLARTSAQRWSRQRGAYHARVAEALVALSVLEADLRDGDAELVEELQQCARELCRVAIARQQKGGRFRTNRNSPARTDLHPHMYAAEGLWAVGRALGEECYVQSAIAAVEWALQQQTDDGWIPQVMFETDGEERPGAMPRTDALAQALSLGCRICSAGLLPEEYWPRLRRLAEWILAQWNFTERRFDYGYLEGGTKRDTLSFWTQAYCLQGLRDYVSAWLSQRFTLVAPIGGKGTRCWPLSCATEPKTVTRTILGDASLVEETVRRFLGTGCLQPSRVFVVASPDTLGMAREQLAELGVAHEHVIGQAEDVRSSLAAINQALNDDGIPDEGLVAITVSDSLLEPSAAFRDALVRALLCARHDRQVLISLGISTTTRDERYGHSVFDTNRADDEFGVHSLEGFVEKPACDEELQAVAGDLPADRRGLAWESGCLVADIAWLRGQVAAAVSAGTGESITEALMDDRKGGKALRRATAVFAPTIRLADLGGLRPELYEFFFGTRRDLGHGNLSLNPAAQVRCFASSGNVIVSDGPPIDLVGLREHVVAVSTVTNVAVVVPMAEWHGDEPLQKLYDHCEPEEWRPFRTGGAAASSAAAHWIAFNCTNSKAHGTAGFTAAYHCDAIHIYRDGDGVAVLDVSRAWPPPRGATPDKAMADIRERVNILDRKRHDAALVRHLLQVSWVAQWLAGMAALPAPLKANPDLDQRELRRLLHLLSMLHDIGGYLTPAEVNREEKTLAAIKAATALDWRLVDSRVIRRVVEKSVEEAEAAELLDALDHFNDSVQSAVVAVDVLGDEPHRDGLLTLLVNQERPAALQAPGVGDLDIRYMAWLWATLKVAEIWVNAHSIWKRRLRQHPREDIAAILTFCADALDELDSDALPQGTLRSLLQRIVDDMREDRELIAYTKHEIRTQDEDGREPAPLYSSDGLLLKCLRSGVAALPRLAEEAVEEAWQQDGARPGGTRLALLAEMPAHVRHLTELGITGLSSSREIAIAVRNAVEAKERELGHQTLDGGPRSTLYDESR